MVSPEPSPKEHIMFCVSKHILGTRIIQVFQGPLFPGYGLTVSSWSEKYSQAFSAKLEYTGPLSKWNPGLSPSQSVHWAPEILMYN